jgi:hypothetical protein
VSLAFLAFAPPASAAEPTEAEIDAWRDRYDAARTLMLEGRYAEAQAQLVALSQDAPTATDRHLAIELARLCAAYVSRGTIPSTVPPTTLVQAPPLRPIRSTDEITLLYASSLIYGVGSGVWFLLETQPNSALTATLPFAALTAAPVIAVATIDGISKFPRGVPHAISAGLYLGLGEGVWAVGYQGARAARTDGSKWAPETVAGVLWGGATLGGTLGGALGSSLLTTPGRVSFTASTTLWAGALSGLAAGAIFPDDHARAERAYAIGGIGYNAGLASGLLLAGDVSPSVARVRVVDLFGLGGILVGAGSYLTLAGSSDVRLAEGLAAGGAAVGLAAGWLVTSGMKRELPEAPSPHVMWQPSFTPVAGGATIGVAGSL